MAPLWASIHAIQISPNRFGSWLSSAWYLNPNGVRRRDNLKLIFFRLLFWVYRHFTEYKPNKITLHNMLIIHAANHDIYGGFSPF